MSSVTTQHPALQSSRWLHRQWHFQLPITSSGKLGPLWEAFIKCYQMIINMHSNTQTGPGSHYCLRSCVSVIHWSQAWVSWIWLNQTLHLATYWRIRFKANSQVGLFSVMLLVYWLINEYFHGREVIIFPVIYIHTHTHTHTYIIYMPKHKLSLAPPAKSK